MPASDVSGRSKELAYMIRAVGWKEKMRVAENHRMRAGSCCSLFSYQALDALSVEGRSVAGSCG